LSKRTHLCVFSVRSSVILVWFWWCFNYLSFPS